MQTHGKFIGSFYGFKGYKSKSQEDQQKHLNTVHKCLEDIENSLVLPFSLGKDFTLADVLIVPWFERLCAIEKFFDLKFLVKYPKIQEWFKTVSQRDSIKVTRQTDEFYIEGYKSYFD